MVDYRSRLAACVPDVLVLPCRPRMDATFTTARTVIRLRG